MANVTDNQIELLLAEAAAAGDLLQEALCRVALGQDISGRGCFDAWRGSAWQHAEDADVRTECARIIGDVINSGGGDLGEARQLFSETLSALAQMRVDLSGDVVGLTALALLSEIGERAGKLHDKIVTENCF